MHPTNDIQVLEIGLMAAGPQASLILADYGANVIKIEHPERGDQMREAGEPGSGFFHGLNRDKRSVALNLQTDVGREAFLELVRESDVLIENLSPNAMNRMGLGYERLRQENNELIYAEINGFADGPYAERAGTDPIAEAMSGLMFVTGHPDSPPARAGASIVDMMCASNTVIAIFHALLKRQATGTGQHITIPLFETAVASMSNWIAYRQMFDREPQRLGASHELHVPYNAYATADDEFVFIGVTNDRHWKRLKELLELSVPLSDRNERLSNRERIDETVNEATSEWEQEELVAALTDADVPAGPVNNIQDVVDDSHLEEVGLFTEVDITKTEPDTHEERIRLPLFPIMDSDIEIQGGERPPPELGEHTAAVLDETDLSESVKELIIRHVKESVESSTEAE
jgi:crotonobetainyl-CoA:carnitine CoA-transferase CaiB-like acyl-CoA transferase